MSFADRRGPPYWLRAATPEELETHLRLMTTLHKLETQSGHIEATYGRHSQTAEESTPLGSEGIIPPSPSQEEPDNLWVVDRGEVD
jgi:hypothetical protein